MGDGMTEVAWSLLKREDLTQEIAVRELTEAAIGLNVLNAVHMLSNGDPRNGYLIPEGATNAEIIDMIKRAGG
jgi:hypothetical protein